MMQTPQPWRPNAYRLNRVVIVQVRDADAVYTVQYGLTIDQARDLRDDLTRAIEP